MHTGMLFTIWKQRVSITRWNWSIIKSISNHRYRLETGKALPYPLPRQPKLAMRRYSVNGSWVILILFSVMNGIYPKWILQSMNNGLSYAYREPLPGPKTIQSGYDAFYKVRGSASGLTIAIAADIVNGVPMTMPAWKALIPIPSNPRRCWMKPRLRPFTDPGV